MARVDVEKIERARAWVDRLRGVRIVYAHTNESIPCPDGTGSAMLATEAFELAGVHGVEVEFLAHGAKLERLKPREGALFVDLCPESHAGEWLEAGAIVLDHHKSRADVVRAFEEAGQGRFGDNGRTESGAQLAFDEVWAPLVRSDSAASLSLGRIHSRREFAELVAVRDTWRKSDQRWEEACRLSEVLTALGHLHALGPVRAEVLSWARLMPANQGLWRLGDAMRFERGMRALDRVRQTSRFVTSIGTRVAVVATTDTSDVIEHMPHVDLLVGFRYEAGEDGEAIRLSCRSTAYDCAAFCAWVRPGGGGHKTAAGVRVPLGGMFDRVENGQPSVEPRGTDPFSFIRACVELYERHELAGATTERGTHDPVP